MRGALSPIQVLENDVAAEKSPLPGKYQFLRTHKRGGIAFAVSLGATFEDVLVVLKGHQSACSPVDDELVADVSQTAPILAFLSQ